MQAVLQGLLQRRRLALLLAQNSVTSQLRAQPLALVLVDLQLIS